MFGGAKPPFGNSSSGFGFNNTNTVTPFGQPAFGKPATAAFGQQNTSLFNNNNASTGIFGASATPAFGATNPQTNTTGFGGFSQPQTTSLFGNNTANTGNTSLFGASAPGTSSAFAKPSGFGFSQPTSLFGSASTTNTTGNGPFFMQNNNASTSAGIFGSGTTSAFASTNTAGGNGTAIAKYTPTLGSDTLVKGGQTTNVNTKQLCITFMKEYENKSVEELRLEDYMANRKGAQPGSSNTGMFGSSVQPNSMFSSTAGQPSTGMFGQPQTSQTTSTIFGTTNNTISGFGQQTPAFGSPQQQPVSQSGLFGKPFNNTQPLASNTFGGFNQQPQTQTNAFDSMNKPFAQSTGIFGQPQNTTGFGQPAATPFSGFGTTNQQPQQAQTSVFGTGLQTQTNSFGLGTQTSNSGFTGFGTNTNTNTAGSSIFNKPANTFATPFPAASTAAPSFGTGAFGQTNTGSSIFNNSLNKPGVAGFSGFGAQPATNTLGGLGSSFGNTSSIFNNNNAAKPSLFGQPGTSAFGTTNSSPFGTTLGGGMGSSLLGGGGMSLGGAQTNNQQNTVPIHNQLWQMGNASPYGENPIFKDLKPLASTNENLLKATNPAAQKALLEQNSTQFKVSPKIGNGVKIKPVNSILTKKSLFEGLEEYDSSLEESFSLKPSAKRLIIKPRITPKSLNNSNLNNSTSRTLNDSGIQQAGIEMDNSFSNSPRGGARESFQNNLPLNPLPIESNDNGRRVSWLQTNTLDKVRQTNKLSDSILDNTANAFASGKDNDNSTGLSTVHESYSPKTTKFNAQTSNDTFTSNRSFSEDISQELILPTEMEPHPTGITLRRSGYYTKPTLDELLGLLDESGRCIVPNFTIGRYGYGNVYFNESFDVAGLNLDEIVHFRHKEVVIYPDDENKPEVGTGLNRKAQITLDQVWPHDKTLHEPIKDPDRLALLEFESKLRRVCDKHDTKFLEYRVDTGSWVFKVDHFSKYGLSDSEDEDDVVKVPTDPKKPKMGMIAGLQKPQNIDLTKNGQANGTLGKSKYGNNTDLINNNAVLENEYTVDLMAYPTSPSAAVALGMKTDSHKLQLMKASFFVDDDYDGKSVMSDITEGRESPDQTVPNNRLLFLRKNNSVFSSSTTLGEFPLSGNISVNSDPIAINDVVMENALSGKQKDKPKSVEKILRPVGPRAVMPLIVKPKITLINIRETSIPLEYSILSKFLDFRGNLAFFNGKKFKIGWDNENTLHILNTAERCNILEKAKKTVPLLSILKGRDNDDFSASVIQKVKISSLNKISNFTTSIEDHLLIQLNTDKRIKIDDTDCPYYQENGGTTALAEHLDLAQKLSKLGKAEDYNLTVWSLINSLWGYREELDDARITNHKSIMFRREQFSEWIENVITDTSLLQKTIDKQDYLDHLWALILCHKIVDACELAFNNNDVNLALLISQISGGPRVRQLVEKQLVSWNEIDADSFIAVKRLKILMLISGVSIMSSNNGPINIFEEMDWLKALAISLWYLCSPTSSITDSLLLYEKSFMAEEFYSNSPIPPYHEKCESRNANIVYDIRYHLLKLYSKRSHPMECLLNPSTHTSDPMDYRLSWLIMQQLETLGYHHLSELSRSHIHVSFANQLENHGLWHWSIYVLLHLRDQSRRELAIQDLLYRYIEVSDYDETYLEKESFLVNDIGIPSKWLYWAKAVKSGARRRYDEQANYLLKAKQWSMAHEIIMNHIAPDTIINDDIEHLKNLLDQFEDTNQISNWAHQGKILSDFIKLNEEFEEIKCLSENEIELRLNNIQHKISYLCSVIKLLPCPTSKHRLCQSEIAQRLAYLVRTINDGNPSINFSSLMSAALKKLPLPPDYTLRELDHVLTARKFQK